MGWQGCYHPRMARPFRGTLYPERVELPNADEYEAQLATMRAQLVSFMRLLDDICQTVHPSTATFDTYGHSIRNLLILACTEVESHWRGVLLANGCERDRFTTHDYVKLAKPMRLGDYGIRLPYYPGLDPFRPFNGWAEGSKPSQGLRWYDAYNKVKHDRDGEFHRAKLVHVFDAVVACAVMLIAQFGETEAFRWRTEFGWFFWIKDRPSWEADEVYIPPPHPDPWTKREYKFA